MNPSDAPYPRGQALDSTDTTADIRDRMSAAQQELIPWLVLVVALGSLGYLGYLVLFASPRTPLLLTHLALITIAVLVGVRGALFWRPLPLPGINPFLACVVGLLLVNCAAASLVGSGEHTAFPLALLLVGSGGFILSRAWLAIVAGSIWAVFFWLAWHGLGWDPFNLGILAVAMVLAFSIHHLHSQMFRLATLRQTAATRAQQSLREAMLAAPSFEGILVHDKGRILKANEAIASLFGLPPQELPGRDISLFFAVDSWPLVADSVLLGNFHALESTCVRQNGSTFPAELFSKKVSIENQDLVVTVIRDVSDRKRAETTLDEERRQMVQSLQRQTILLEVERAIERPGEVMPILNQIVQAAAHLLPASLGSCLVLRDETGQLKIASNAFRNPSSSASPSLGFKPGAATQWMMDQQESLVISHLGSDPFGIRDVFPGLDIEAYAGVPVITTGVVSGLLFIFEHQPRTFKKDDLDFLNSLAGKASALFARAHLTQSLDHVSQKLEQQRAELEKRIADLTRARDAAEAACQARSEFLHRANQELRTSLDELRSHVQSLFLASLTDEQQQAAEILRDKTGLVQSRLAIVTDYGQVLAGSLKINTLDFDLNEVLKNAIRTHVARAQNKNLELICNASGHIPRNLRGDAARLEQVLAELLANAIRFTDRGQIEVSVTQTQPAPGIIRLRFEVRDTGKGIAPEQQNQLFQPFAPMEDSIPRSPAGLRLGLALCRSLVKLMEGQIGVQSRPGIGSTFWFTAHVKEALIIKS